MSKIIAKNLIIRTSNWLGDSVMSLFTLKAIKTISPEAKITVLTKKSIEELYKVFKVADEIIPFEARHRIFSMFSEKDLTAKLMSKQFDVALTIPNSYHSARIFYKSKIPTRIGFSRFIRNYMLTHKLKQDEDERKRHRIEKIFQLSRFFGVAKIGDVKLTPEINEDLKNYASNLLKENNITQDGLIIGINAGAQYGWSKQWPMNYFVVLCKKLLEYDNKCKIILFGNSNDSVVNMQIKTNVQSDNVIDLSGRTNLEQLSAILRFCKLFVTNDTGTMHLANLLGVNVVAIFGSTSYLLTGPYLKPHVIIKHSVGCSPCFLRYCPIDHRCMRSISPDEVFTQCKKEIEKAKE